MIIAGMGMDTDMGMVTTAFTRRSFLDSVEAITTTITMVTRVIQNRVFAASSPFFLF